MTIAAKKPTLQGVLARLDACEEAVRWVGRRTLSAAWRDCDRGDWMLWYAAKCVRRQSDKTHLAVVLAACECARLALPHVPAGELRPLEAIEITERWARGGRDRPPLDDVRAAAHAADAFAASAAYAAVYAAAHAYAHAYASAASAAFAADASHAARAAAYASHAARAAVRTQAPKQCADIVRRHFPRPPKCST